MHAQTWRWNQVQNMQFAKDPTFSRTRRSHKEPSRTGHMLLIAKYIGMCVCLREPNRLVLPRKCSPDNIPRVEVSLLLQIKADHVKQPQEALRLFDLDALRGAVEHDWGHVLAACRIGRRRRHALANAGIGWKPCSLWHLAWKHKKSQHLAWWKPRRSFSHRYRQSPTRASPTTSWPAGAASP